MAEPEAEAPAPASAVPMPARPPAAPRAGWTFALAAMLTLCILGLAYLTGKVQQQAGTVAHLNSRMQVLPVQDLSALSSELTALRRRFHMVTAIARKAYPMKMVRQAPGVQTDGVMYVCGNHQRWYLNVQGLEAPPPGREYNLWFVTEQGMVHGGTVTVSSKASSELEASAMPVGTHGFAITLEESGAAGPEPEGPMVLLGEEAISI